MFVGPSPVAPPSLTCLCCCCRLQLQVGVEFEASTRMQETSVSFGYTLDVPKANLLFKGTLPVLLADTVLGRLRR